MSRDRWCRRYCGSPCTCGYWQELRTCAPQHNAEAPDRPHATRWDATGIAGRRRIEGPGSIRKLYFCFEKQSPINRIAMESFGENASKATVYPTELQLPAPMEKTCPGIWKLQATSSR